MTQLSLPFTLDDFGGIDKVYIDQGPRRNIGVVSFYTPLGIKQIDRDFCKIICEFSGDLKDYKN